MKKEIRSFELVLCGHPDKVCDTVSKAIADVNIGGRNAIECMWGNQLFIVSGETNKQWLDDDLALAVGKVLRDVVGLTVSELESIQIINNLNIQSSEIDDIVGEAGTGDNGIYFGGYHKVYSPVIRKMKDLCSALTVSALKRFGYRTDGKFIFDVDKRGNVTRFVINVASFSDVIPNTHGFTYLIEYFVGCAESIISVNPKGNWSKCFGFADTGLTGRKLACDGSCGLFAHGGGAMFGKDMSKADVTVPLYLADLAEKNIGRFQKECTFSAASIIGDTELDVYKDEKYFDRISFNDMKNFVSGKRLDRFGVLRDVNYLYSCSRETHRG